MHGTIAVVIPAHNAGDRIHHAIHSVRQQTRPADEVIVVDDGSTDATAEIAAGIADIRLLRQANRGSAVARQVGTDAADSDFIAYLDADDWWPPEKLAECAAVLEGDRVAFLLADLQRALPEDPVSAYLPRNSTFFPWAIRNIRHQAEHRGGAGWYRLAPRSGLDLFLGGFPPYPSTFVVEKTALKDTGGWDARFRRCQDFDLALRLARRHPVHYVDRVHAILGLHAGNQDEYAYNVSQAEGDLQVLKRHRDAPGETPAYRRLVERALVRKLWQIAYAHRRAGRHRLASRAYRRSLAYRHRRARSALRWLAASLAGIGHNGTRGTPRPRDRAAHMDP